MRESSRLRIVVAGYIVRGPLGGMAWSPLQYVLGLRQLGHDVRFIEDSEDFPSCHDPVAGLGTDPTYGLRFAASAFEHLGMGSCWAYHDAHRDCWQGPAAADIEGWCASADLLVNVAGVNPVRPWLEPIPVRVLIDADPAFTQIRNLRDPWMRERSAAHSSFFTFAERFGEPDCLVPDDGFPWKPTRQPIVLDAWPMTPLPTSGALTTVMQWESYPAESFEGQEFGMKSASFTPFFSLPRRCHQELLVAINNPPPETRSLLATHGWQVRDPTQLSTSIETYRDFIQSSIGEISVAKHGYVVSRSGWFSERTAAYLASGRPAVAQDTGFSTFLPTGEGLLAFTDFESAIVAMDRLHSDPGVHSVAARELIAEHFSSEKVLGRLLSDAFAT